MTPPSEPPLQDSDGIWKERFEKLRDEYNYLQARATRFSAIEQELITSRHLIDLERRRFEAIGDFNRKAVRLESVKECAKFVSEGIVDILECEIGIIWLAPNETSDELLFCSRGEFLECSKHEVLLDWIRNSTKAARDQGLSRQDPPEILGFRDFLIQDLLVEEMGWFGLIIAANTTQLADFYDRFSGSTNDAFSAFASQAGAILESLKRRETISEQVGRIRLSEERLALALECSNVGLWDWDLSSGRVFYSEQWKRMIGHRHNEIADHFEEWSGRLHPLDRERASKIAINCSKRTGAVFDQIFRLRHRNGSWRWIVARGVTMPGGDGRPERVIGTHIDVSSYKRLENRLRKSEASERLAKEAALQQSLAKSSFLARVSHEIRTPLNGILGVYQILKELPQTKEVHELLEMAERSGDWMLDIIGDSLDLARIEAGKLELSNSPFDLSNLVVSLVENKCSKAAAKGIDLNLKLCPDLPVLLIGDHWKIRQILSNLIDNAIKFTDRGFVEVCVEHGKSNGSRNQTEIRFRVRDTGVGIPKESRASIFQPFEQLDAGNSRRYGGVGLGLAISRSLIQLMKGSIRVMAPKSGGSEFVVTIPMLRPSDTIGKLQEKSDERLSFTGRVLLAEDDEVSRMIEVRMLEKLGFEVVSAPDGAVALELYDPEKFDLVVLDCWMPNFSGLEVCSKIRIAEIGGSERIPILAMTANVESSSEIECLQAGVDAFLGKPVNYRALTEALVLLLPDRLKLTRTPISAQ